MTFDAAPPMPEAPGTPSDFSFFAAAVGEPEAPGIVANEPGTTCFPILCTSVLAAPELGFGTGELPRTWPSTLCPFGPIAPGAAADPPGTVCFSATERSVAFICGCPSKVAVRRTALRWIRADRLAQE